MSYINNKAKVSHNFSLEIMEKAIIELILKEPFYANMTMNMTRQLRTDIPTAGVNVTENVNLIINPYFWNSLSITEQMGVLKHECLHVLHNHIARFAEIDPETYNKKEHTLKDRIKAIQNARELNIAADLAINEYLPELPKTWSMFDENGNIVLQPEKILDQNGNEIDNPNANKPVECNPCIVNDMKVKYPDMQNEMTMEYYYQFLREEKQKNGEGDGEGNGGGFAIMDDHSIWSDGDIDPEYIKEKVRQVANKALEQTMDRNAGIISGEISNLIEKLNHKPKDWRSDLQRFVARNVELVVESSRKKRNRRYGIIFPGQKIDPKLHLCIAIDTSGSVQDEELRQFLAEITAIHKNNVKVTIVECDAEVQAVYEFNPKKQPKIKGRGGTAFIPVFEEVEKKEFKSKYGEIDGLVYLTDGCNFEGNQLKKPKFPVLWAILDGYKCQYDWGFKTTITVKKKNN